MLLPIFVDPLMENGKSIDPNEWPAGSLGDVNLFYGISRVKSKKDYAPHLDERFPHIPPILFLCASNLAMCFGWWKLRTGGCRRDSFVGIVFLLLGFPASVWGWIVFGDRIF